MVEVYTGSSQYVSAESESFSDMSLKIERMSLGPMGAALIRDRVNQVKMESRSKNVYMLSRPTSIEPNTLQSYFDAAMEKFVKRASNNRSSEKI